MINLCVEPASPVLGTVVGPGQHNLGFTGKSCSMNYLPFHSGLTTKSIRFLTIAQGKFHGGCNRKGYTRALVTTAGIGIAIFLPGLNRRGFNLGFIFKIFLRDTL